MLDIKWFREKPLELRLKLQSRGLDGDLSIFERLDGRRREILVQSEDLRATRNRASQDISRLKKGGLDASQEIARMKEVGDHIAGLEEELRGVDAELGDFLLRVPNVPDDSVPVGTGAEDNVEVYRWGRVRQFDFPVQDHVDIGRRLGILDMERASKITGARFAVYRKTGAELERALIQFMLDVHTREHGYEEVWTPFMVNEESLRGTGNLPKFEADLFRLQGWPYFLIPTAEVPVTNLYRGEVLDEGALPIRHVAYSPCFRSEAGAAGKDTRGLIRQHQFNKVEVVKFCRPEDSMRELESLTEDAEDILKKLDLPFRRVALSTGDLGFSSAKTYDLEVWLPSMNKYVEISSCSNFKDFQARRADIRCRAGREAKPRFAHTLNGSGLAVGRTWLAVLENYQNSDGSVTVPEVLRPYMHGLDAIREGA